MEETNYKLNLERNIWKFYVFKILGGFILFYPIVVLFWQQNGLSMTKIMILQSLFSFIVIALEVPTGYFADVYGRKKSLILSSIFLLIGVTFYSMGHNFWQFLIAEAFWALGAAFMSGADSALLYDTLEDLDKTSSYKKIYGKSVFYGLISLATASIFGGFIGSHDYRFTFYFMIPLFAALFFLTLTLTEPDIHKEIKKRGMLKAIRYTLIENRNLRWIIIFISVILTLNWVSWMYEQVYFKMIGIDVAYFGIILAAFTLFAALVSKYAHKIEEKIGQRNSLFLLTGSIVMGYFLLSNIVFWFSFVFFLFLQFVYGFADPVISDYINKLAASDIRATILSIESLCARMVYAMIIPFIGYFSDIYGITQTFMLLCFTALISGGAILFFMHKSKVI